LNNNEKQKILKNILQTLKLNGQVFVYESEWSKDKGENIHEKKNPLNFLFFIL
jgi:hypothetical protein